MSKFDINKLRSAGLQYLVVDRSGQVWAFEKLPVRTEDHWRLADEHLCPALAGLEYDEHWRRVRRWRLRGREFCMPLSDCPIPLDFHDDPYDIVENGLVAPGDFKIWPTEI